MSQNMGKVQYPWSWPNKPVLYSRTGILLYKTSNTCIPGLLRPERAGSKLYITMADQIAVRTMDTDALSLKGLTCFALRTGPRKIWEQSPFQNQNPNSIPAK